MKSIIPGDKPGVCFVCSRIGSTDVHHMLHGTRRAKADEYGLTVNLCPNCHRQIHDKGINDLALEKLAQRQFERKYGHHKWMLEFGKSYL